MTDREIDKMVAKKVMGWTEIREGKRVDFIGVDPERIDYDRIPHYSTDIKDAWQVIVRMRGLGWHYEISSTDRGADSVRFGQGNYNRYEDEWTEEYREEGEVPMATCLAALAIMGIKLP